MRWGRERRYTRARDAARRAAAGTPLASYYAIAPPGLDDPLFGCELCALDFELDGLEPQRDSILEVGWVHMTASTIQLSSARSRRVRSPGPLRPSSVVIHGITDDAAAEGAPEPEVLTELVACLAGRALVAHCAEIERAFLDAACRRCFGVPFVAPFICTLELENRWFRAPRTADGLRLGKLRAQYGLPHYRAHCGLTDALACGELLMAQIARRNAPDLTLRSAMLSP